MNKKLHLIRQKVETIRHGLLRFNGGAGQQTQVSSSIDADNQLNCIIKDHNVGNSLLNSRVSLIQKNNDDYLYISGRIDDEVKTNCKIVSFKISKACWFIRKRKGNAIWLQEKYIYECPEKEIEKAS